MSTKLPTFIDPMLLKSGEPFDSPDYLFEIKWDGTRALAIVENSAVRLVNRRENVITDRYPDLTPDLARVTSGTILDGEIVVLNDGKPDFNQLQSREQARAPLKVNSLARSCPATFMVFDLLYYHGQSIMKLPLTQRRGKLDEAICLIKSPRIIMSSGVVESGKQYFQLAVEQGLEGIVAKRMASSYTPGKRSEAWIKIKRGEETLCAIIGFVPAEGGALNSDFQSLILATILDGDLSFCGRVGSGIDYETRAQINDLIWERVIPKPAVPEAEQKLGNKGIWVRPGIFCKIRYMERTKNNEFRAPVFEDLIVES